MASVPGSGLALLRVLLLGLIGTLGDGRGAAVAFFSKGEKIKGFYSPAAQANGEAVPQPTAQSWWQEDAPPSQWPQGRIKATFTEHRPRTLEEGFSEIFRSEQAQGPARKCILYGRTHYHPEARTVHTGP